MYQFIRVKQSTINLHQEGKVAVYTWWVAALTVTINLSDRSFSLTMKSSQRFFPSLFGFWFHSALFFSCRNPEVFEKGRKSFFWCRWMLALQFRPLRMLTVRRFCVNNFTCVVSMSRKNPSIMVNAPEQTAFSNWPDRGRSFLISACLSWRAFP